MGGTGECRWVTERKRKLDGRVQEFPCQALVWTPVAAVLLYRPGREVVLGDLRLPADALTFGLYWAERPFNIYHWLDAAGRTLACYCNVASETRIGPEVLEWLDLELDVLVTSDGVVRFLDADEVPADLPAPYRRQLQLARRRLADGPAVLALAREMTPS